MRPRWVVVALCVWCHNGHIRHHHHLLLFVVVVGSPLPDGNTCTHGPLCMTGTVVAFVVVVVVDVALLLLIPLSLPSPHQTTAHSHLSPVAQVTRDWGGGGGAAKKTRPMSSFLCVSVFVVVVVQGSTTSNGKRERERDKEGIKRSERHRTCKEQSHLLLPERKRPESSRS